MIVSKRKGARERIKAKMERWKGRKPFGHYPGEDAVLNRMKQLRSKGFGFDRLAVKLNEEGFKPPNGDKWQSV